VEFREVGPHGGKKVTLAAEQLSTSCAEQSAICRPNTDARISGFQRRRQTMRCPASRMQLQPAIGTKLSYYTRQVVFCFPYAHARTHARMHACPRPCEYRFPPNAIIMRNSRVSGDVANRSHFVLPFRLGERLRFIID